ncbi:MAG: DinB family protein [Actinomycetota bacterium]
MPARTFEVAIEEGSKRAFASATDWPGWSRSGRGEEEALEALFSYGARYAAALDGSRVRFAAPTQLGALRVGERVEGNATTDFGAPDGVFAADERPIGAVERRRLRTVLEASWSAFDRAADAAVGLELRKGPRGGGRSMDAIVGHVVQAEAGYLRRLTGSGTAVDEDDPWASRQAERSAVLDGLDRAAAGDVPKTGPRGGKIWRPRRFLRRAAWHVLDHAWEIEDRSGA